jgi:hypothetical protein
LSQPGAHVEHDHVTVALALPTHRRELLDDPRIKPMRLWPDGSRCGWNSTEPSGKVAAIAFEGGGDGDPDHSVWIFGSGCVDAKRGVGFNPMPQAQTRFRHYLGICRRLIVRSGWLWTIEKVTALFAILSFVAVVYFGLYPRPPIEAPLDPDTLYREGAPIGHVLAFNVEPVLAGQFVFQVEASKPIEKGDALRFRHATCFVVDLGQPPRQLPNNLIFFNGISCRVVGG